MRRLFCGFLIAVLTPCLGGCGAAPTVAPITRAARPPAKAPAAYQPVVASRGPQMNQPGAFQPNNQANGYGVGAGNTARPGQPQTTAQPTPRPVNQPRR